MMPLEHIDFYLITGYWTSNKVILTYFIRRNPMPQHRLLFPISSKRSFPTDMTEHNRAFDEPVMDHWLEWKIVQTANGSTENEVLLNNQSFPFWGQFKCRLVYIKNKNFSFIYRYFIPNITHKAKYTLNNYIL